MSMSSVGLRLEKYCVGEFQQQLQITDPSSLQRGYPVRNKTQQSIENFQRRERKIGCESQMVA
jgi:hypothetical protein